MNPGKQDSSAMLFKLSEVYQDFISPVLSGVLLFLVR